MNLLHVENLTKIFNIHILSDKIIEGFRGVSFSVPQGTSLGISGPSGTGKSSVLKCIYGTYITTSGAIWYESAQFGKVNMAEAEPNVITRIRENEIGYITQFLKVIPRVTALDIVSEPLVLKGTDREQARETAAKLLLKLGIPEKLFGAYPATFSGGEQQRVNIAMAVIKAPRLLILDEPTASLDIKATETVLSVLEELREKGTTMIGIFHQPQILELFSDTIYKISSIGGRS